VDEDREKISKSKQGQGGYDKPQTSDAYVKKWGVDVVRLWVSSQDFRNDIVVSEKRIEKVSETYRIIRNALRYQLSNLYDFDPATHAVPEAHLDSLDRWILGEFAVLEREVLAAYEVCEYHLVYQKISQFAAVELSSIYHDTVKDRLYTDAASSARRRSTQTALHRMVTGLCQMLSPILVFTADEAWEYLPGRTVPSVHQSEWKSVGLEVAEAERLAWKTLFEVRQAVLPELEKARQAKLIGKALEAKVTLTGPAEAVVAAVERTSALRELLNVSQLEVKLDSTATSIGVTVNKADGSKCERCWHCETSVGATLEHATLCGRCVEAVKACA